MRKIKLVQIQTIYAKNEPLHTYLKSISLNKQSNIFFMEVGSDITTNVFMLSESGHLFKFVIENGKYHSIRLDDPLLLADVIRITEQAVYKYPYYEDTLKQSKHSLNYTPRSQGLF